MNRPLIRLLGAFSALLLAVAAGPLLAQGRTPLPHYEIDATVHPTQGTLEATVAIRLPPGTGERRFLLGSTYGIQALSAEGGEVDSATVQTPIPGLRALTLRASGSAGATMRVRYRGPLFALTKPPINVVTDSLVELSVDSFWIPYDASFGAPFTVSARVQGLPSGGIGISNIPHRFRDGVLTIASDSAGTSDLTVIGATNLAPREAGRLRMYAGDHSSPLVSYYLEHGGRGLAWLEGLLGPMPSPTAIVSVVRRANRSGYARPGYIVVTDNPNTVPGPGQAKFIVHEFAHLWFSRTSTTTEDYWLTESPAEYLGLRYVRDSLGDAAFESIMAGVRTAAAQAPPILGAGRARDAALYAKGPVLLFELEARIGRERMDALLLRLAREPRHDTAVFLSALRGVIGGAVASDFEQRLRR